MLGFDYCEKSGYVMSNLVLTTKISFSAMTIQFFLTCKYSVKSSHLCCSLRYTSILDYLQVDLEIHVYYYYCSVASSVRKVTDVCLFIAGFTSAELILRLRRSRNPLPLHHTVYVFRRLADDRPAPPGFHQRCLLHLDKILQLWAQFLQSAPIPTLDTSQVHCTISHNSPH